MPRISVYQGQMPEGAERYGASPTSQQAALVPSYMGVAGTELAPPSGVLFGVVDNCTALTKKNEACNGPKANGTDFCIGHLRQLEKLQREGTEAIMAVQAKPPAEE